MYAKWAAKRWHDTIQQGMQTVTDNKIVVFYEDLMDNLADGLTKLTSFLNITISKRRLPCTLTYKEGNFHRKPRAMTFDPFTEDLRVSVNDAVRSAREIMKSYGGPPMRNYQRNVTSTFGNQSAHTTNDTMSVCKPCQRLVHL